MTKWDLILLGQKACPANIPIKPVMKRLEQWHHAATAQAYRRSSASPAIMTGRETVCRGAMLTIAANIRQGPVWNNG